MYTFIFTFYIVIDRNLIFDIQYLISKNYKFIIFLQFIPTVYFRKCYYIPNLYHSLSNSYTHISLNSKNFKIEN